jgi:hypothetical protein
MFAGQLDTDFGASGEMHMPPLAPPISAEDMFLPPDLPDDFPALDLPLPEPSPPLSDDESASVFAGCAFFFCANAGTTATEHRTAT